ncbi:hypothetical protein PUNSTDRAFT_122759 [Punctularia strigosozonata HHB-11173 SS5]|uniref:Uncharacterized protein n=1 Tax=Punctularia strigosozonata (strain HHB-11173) TaxID=741275 RepID=R7S4N5_PUNST|nr:uncharacterized protein PUNSTDRAFT_122759 [Punctularia strigosozonata HHB-11173 SS5]EIN04747.1 hypothetical protein PUNSTDRAFT_122759 [Punctularia strigosozonata HHB-11173 SS5]
MPSSENDDPDKEQRPPWMTGGRSAPCDPGPKRTRQYDIAPVQLSPPPKRQRLYVRTPSPGPEMVDDRGASRRSSSQPSPSRRPLQELSLSNQVYGVADAHSGLDRRSSPGPSSRVDVEQDSVPSSALLPSINALYPRTTWERDVQNIPSAQARQRSPFLHPVQRSQDDPLFLAMGLGAVLYCGGSQPVSGFANVALRDERGTTPTGTRTSLSSTNQSAVSGPTAPLPTPPRRHGSQPPPGVATRASASHDGQGTEAAGTALHDGRGTKVASTALHEGQGTKAAGTSTHPESWSSAWLSASRSALLGSSILPPATPRRGASRPLHECATRACALRDGQGTTPACAGTSTCSTSCTSASQSAEAGPSTLPPSTPRRRKPSKMFRRRRGKRLRRRKPVEITSRITPSTAPSLIAFWLRKGPLHSLPLPLVPESNPESEYEYEDDSEEEELQRSNLSTAEPIFGSGSRSPRPIGVDNDKGTNKKSRKGKERAISEDEEDYEHDYSEEGDDGDDSDEDDLYADMEG